MNKSDQTETTLVEIHSQLNTLAIEAHQEGNIFEMDKFIDAANTVLYVIQNRDRSLGSKIQKGKFRP